METPDLSLVAFGFDLIPRKVRQLNEQGNNSRENDEVIYEDFSPFMLIGDGSLKELNQKLEKKLQWEIFDQTLWPKIVRLFPRIIGKVLQ